MDQKPRVGIVGASGYAGGELVRILARAPLIRLTYLASETFAGKAVSAAFPGIRITEPVFQTFEAKTCADSCDLVFLAQGNGTAMKLVPELLAAGNKVVDLSADFRLRDPGAYPLWYKMPHTWPKGIEQAVYGLPERHREAVRTAKLVANPGCYTTASILALLPLVEGGLVDLDSIVVDAKSGVSGAGRSRLETEYLFSEINESVRAYAVGGKHRHTPEIEQELSAASGTQVRLTFTPHLIPMTRGILAVCYAKLNHESCALDESALLARFERRYAEEPFVAVYPLGELPSSKAALGSNHVHIGLSLDSRAGRVIVVSALDNLVKGAAGQAIQNMNLMLGLPETHALEAQGLWP